MKIVADLSLGSLKQYAKYTLCDIWFWKFAFTRLAVEKQTAAITLNDNFTYALKDSYEKNPLQNINIRKNTCLQFTFNTHWHSVNRWRFASPWKLRMKIWEKHELSQLVFASRAVATVSYLNILCWWRINSRKLRGHVCEFVSFKNCM